MRKLAQRESEVFNLILVGLKTTEISHNLGLKPNTISTIKKSIMNKLEVNNLFDLYKHAVKSNMIKIK